MDDNPQAGKCEIFSAFNLWVGLPNASIRIIIGKITTLEVAMEKAVSAADANRKFSHILRSVREGHSFVVTSHGRPVARIVPADEHGGVSSGARAMLVARLERQPVANSGHWTRDELYEDEQR